MEEKILVSKEVIENIDLEEGKIKVRGEWLTEDELRYAIRMKVDSDDYNVADLAVALKTLISEMNKSTVLRVRVPKELAESFEEISKQRGHSIESMLRTILIDFINEKEEMVTPITKDISLDDSHEELEAEIVDIIEGNFPEEDEDEEDIEIVRTGGMDRQLIEMESTTVDSEPEGTDENLDEVDLSDIDNLDEELEEELKEFEPTPKVKKSPQKRVLRRKKVKHKKG
jgi:hypothetical protein